MTGADGAYVERSLAVARDLVAVGVPVFAATPANTSVGFALPPGWQRSDATTSRRALDFWRPGMALCAVMGHTLDLIDIDPRNGTPDWDAVETWPTIYASAATPSGGVHYFIASLRVGSRDDVLPGLDIKGGRGDGEGRGFAFIAPTVRPNKLDGIPRPYVWTTEPDAHQVAEMTRADRSGAALAALVAGKLSGGGTVPHLNGNGSRPAAPVGGVLDPARTFTREGAAAFVEPHLQALAASRHGQRNALLNAAAKVMSHFGDEFWTVAQARESLLRALPVNPSRRWDPDQTIASAYRSAEHDWRADLVEAPATGATFPGAVHVEPPAPTGALNLPETFWAARPALGHIRAAAHCRGRSGDVALFAVLARMAALWPHDIRLDTGVATPASANLYVAVVGPSGSGKSTGAGVAEDLVPVPSWCREPGKFADSWPLGTGEGIAEAFMGWDYVPARPNIDEEGNAVPQLNREGGPKMERVRMQVRHNALFYMDEGEALGRMLERVGATVGETLRRGWTGGTLGQANGRSETTRIINGGTYSIGLMIGFQPETCQLLLADAAAGTPQRFLWAWAADPAIPRDRVAHPGALAAFWPEPLALDWIIGAPDPGRPVTFADTIRERLWQEHTARGRGELAVPELDEHRPLALVKVSTLLAQLDGRRDVTEEDWSLAGMVWATSCAVRDYAVAYGRSMAGKAAAASKAVYVEREGAAEVARLAVKASADDAAVHRVALRIAVKVHEAEGGDGIARRDVQSKVLASRDRGHLVAALDYAAERGWLVEDGLRVRPGDSRPVEPP